MQPKGVPGTVAEGKNTGQYCITQRQETGCSCKMLKGELLCSSSGSVDCPQLCKNTLLIQLSFNPHAMGSEDEERNHTNQLTRDWQPETQLPERYPLWQNGGY